MENEKIFTIPYKVRTAIYITTGLLTPVVIYLLAKGFIGSLEMTLWGAEVTFVMGLAGFNTTPNTIELKNDTIK